MLKLIQYDRYLAGSHFFYDLYPLANNSGNGRQNDRFFIAGYSLAGLFSLWAASLERTAKGMAFLIQQ